MQKGRLLYISIFLALATGVASIASADCTNPPATAGAQLYNADHKEMQFCDGAQWWGMKGGALDLVCAEGDGIVMTSAGYWDCSPGGPP